MAHCGWDCYSVMKIFFNGVGLLVEAIMDSF